MKIDLRNHAGWRQVLVSGAAMVVAAVLTACSGGASDLPAVGGPTALRSTGDLEGVATSIYVCLHDQGFPVDYMMGPDGRSTLITFQDNSSVIWKTPDADLQFTGNVTEQEMQQQILALTKQGTEVPDDPDGWVVFVVDGQDRFDILTSCVEQSGYNEQTVFNSFDPAPIEEAYDRLMLEATNDWTWCAREHGYPSIRDATMPKDSTAADPIAVLPVTTDESELRDLLASCPNFNPTVEQDNDEIWMRVAQGELEANPVPPGLKSQPNIGFDYPGFNGDPENSEWPTGAEAEQIVDRLTKLMAILDEPVETYLGETRG
ncbi:MAG: hypothetical protein LBL55_09160 [Propionibacteriaceae bacterium]|nr:hypothetical protein [Propionibacteriaceae bacterium]